MTTLRTFLAVAVCLLVLVVSSLPVSAQTSLAKTPSGVAVERSIDSAATSPGPLTRLWFWVLDQQRRLMAEMAAAVRRVQSDDPVSSAIVLMVVSFVYGIFHAAGPGHGKFVISSYALANARTARRGILLAFMAALFQAISAIVLMGIVALAVRASQAQIKATEAWLETASWGLIALFGAWLLYRQVRPLIAGVGHHHHHHHDHGTSHGHAHLPDAETLEDQWSWRRAFTLAFSIGIRPCTGAIAVLFVAFSIGLWWIGIFATFAMALGTAITVSTLVMLAVGSSRLATRLAGRESRWGRRIELTVAIAGALLVFALGTGGFIISLIGGPSI